jgi:hypothetical protein
VEANQVYQIVNTQVLTWNSHYLESLAIGMKELVEISNSMQDIVSVVPLIQLQITNLNELGKHIFLTELDSLGSYQQADTTSYAIFECLSESHERCIRDR